MTFDIRDFLLEQEPNLEDPNQQQDPQQMQQQQQEPQQPEQQTGEEGSPEDQEQDMQAQADPTEQVFNEFLGGTIRNIEFQPGPAGGELKISVGQNSVPLTISWANNQTTVMKPDGTVVKLS